MKKAIALVVVLSTAAISFGQHQLGVKAGYNYLFTRYDNVTANAPVIETKGGGYHFGAYYTFSPADNLFLSGEVLVSNRRWSEVSSTKGGDDIKTTEEDYTYFSNHYLEIPLSVKYGINLKNGRYGDDKFLLFYAGPSAHLLMGTRGSTQQTYRIDAHDQATVQQEDIIYTKQELKSYFSPFQMGLHAGVAYSFPFGLMIDVRYQTMLMPTTRVFDPNAATIGEGKGMIKQGMVMFTLGYSFLRD